MLLPLKKEYVPNFDEWIKFSPTFEDIKGIEEIINAEQPQKEKIWGCQDIEFCGMHFILISQTINDNNILYTYMDESNHLKLNATQNDLISVEEKDVFCNSYTTYSQNIYKNDLYYRGKKVFEEHPNKWKHKNALTENEENLPEFTVQISGTKTIDCTGYITVKALNEEMASDMVKQQKINFNDIDWCDDNGTEYYNDIDVVSVARTLYNGDF